jgi:ParB-like chromosome segregation protein Spo0J
VLQLANQHPYRIGINVAKAKQQWPADNIERRQVKSLVPYARNSRTHSPEQVSQIAASITEWGFTSPILVDEAGTIIAGHGRVLAAQQLGLDELPVMTATGWTEAQKQAYIIADNKLALNSGWDMELLKVEMVELDGLDFDLGLIGFDDEEMAQIFDEPLSADEQKDLSDQSERFEVIIECAGEADQERAFNHAQAGGFECRISTF